ncbi:type II toxin-antitoxin system RelE/ParE family toxin [Iodobacter sp. BJB302]|uniref:type II toxin-antitoxin system RelE/ParE family toxin n=1 Tax=Iodobacter sp. BJB302 TaxID=1506510 RepID=UPI000C0E3385|nr:type II toxin-antitoxin system RelE/ParE family toxin [Iodobacter sp. BJB302]PHU99802.1 type II toxin-antitoxin system mRNA interferase toxin, RelE/StbE family [Iodobacter sp. BJB302]
MRIVWLTRARVARENAIEFIAQENLTAALNQLDEIERQVDLLLDHPKLGRAGRVKGTRELVVSRTPFIALYRIVGDEIQVMNLLHGAQQWPK